MSGTSASTRPTRPAAAVGLPVPKIYLSTPGKIPLRLNPNGINYTVARDGKQLIMRSIPLLGPSEIPAELFVRDLRLELLRYSVKKGAGSQRRGRSGYKHPSHGVGTSGPTSWSGATPVAPVLPASKHRGGAIADNGIMVSEWAVADADTSFMLDTLGDFYVPSQIRYFGAAGANVLRGYVPSDRASRGNAAPRNVFGYSAVYRPNYFRFRFSVADVTDPRSRVTGPVGETFVMAPLVHPFIQNLALSQTAGQVVVDVNTEYNPTLFDVWVATRLPGGG